MNKKRGAPMTTLLLKKMIRDMKKSRTAYFLSILIVAIGFCGFAVLELCYDNLAESRDLFFSQSNFCDGFAEVTDSPASQAGILSMIPGIDTAEARLVKDVRVYDYEDDVELHLVSWSAGEMNRPVLSRGSLPGEGKKEIVIGDGIAKARNLNPGDTVEIIVGGKRIPMAITGIGLTPENIYMVRNMSELFPSPSTYDAAFTSYRTLAQLTGQEGHGNSFLIRLSAGTVWEEVEDQVEQALTPYGLISHYAREDQLAVSMVEEEMTQLKKMSAVVPFLFLTVAGVILYITQSRMVEQQRTQIGTLMALGIPLKKIRLHYMGFGAVTGLAGGLAGGILGYLLAGPMADYYRVYFNLPEAAAPLSAAYLLEGILMAVIFCSGTSWVIAGVIGRLKPAQALRPPAPKSARPSFLERIPGFLKLFTVPGIMALRSLSRNRRRTAMSIAGMAFAYMITATLVSMNSLFDVFIFDYWEKTQRQDIIVSFEQPVTAGDALEAVNHPQVERAEAVMEFAVSLAGPEGKTDCTIQAISPESSLTRLFREDGSRAYPEEEGIILSEHMANLMGVKKGSSIEVKVSYPRERISRVTVTDIIAQYMGSAAYMSYKGAEKISDYRDACNTVLLKAPLTVQEELRTRLDDASAVAAIQSRQGRLLQYRSMMGSMSAIMASMSMLGVIISFAVIYISSLISFEELKRELSTLMMLGLKSKECLDVISTGQWILAAGAVLMGIPMAMGASILLSVSMASEMYTIPSFIDGKALLQAIGLTALSVGFSSAMMLRKLKKIVPADLLRERE